VTKRRKKKYGRSEGGGRREKRTIRRKRRGQRRRLDRDRRQRGERGGCEVENGERRKRLEGTSIGKSETGKNGKLLWDHASVPAYLIFRLLLPSPDPSIRAPSAVLLHP